MGYTSTVCGKEGIPKVIVVLPKLHQVVQGKAIGQEID